MTRERSQDVLALALAASVVLHLVLMFWVRPQVMTYVATSDVSRRGRGPMVVADRPRPSEAVRFEAVRDVEAVRESPQIEAEISPEAMSAGAPGADAAPALEMPIPSDTASAVPAEIEIAPCLSEQMHVESGVSDFVTPVADGMVEIVPAPSAAAPAVASSSGAPAVELPMFTAPAYQLAAPVEAEVKLPEAAAEAEFVPSAEVTQQVDEQLVEREKAAVRSLLNDRDAVEFDSYASVAVSSAAEGEWTYFRVVIRSRPNRPAVAKDLVVLLDASGSIGNDRLTSCREAARAILRTATNTGDRFNLVAFRDRFTYAFKSWQPCGIASFEGADRWLSALAAYGRTDVFATIRSVLTLPRDPKRPLVALVVTDGDANVGVSATSDILAKFTALNDGLISVYMYGVKASANRELIDLLTHGNRGESFVYGGVKGKTGSGIEAFSVRFRDPIMSDLRVVFASRVYAETYPRVVRNLYREAPVELFGRIPAGTSEIAFSLRGLHGDDTCESFYRLSLSDAAFDASLPALWKAEKAIDARLRID